MLSAQPSKVLLFQLLSFSQICIGKKQCSHTDIYFMTSLHHPLPPLFHSTRKLLSIAIGISDCSLVVGLVISLLQLLQQWLLYPSGQSELHGFFSLEVISHHCLSLEKGTLQADQLASVFCYKLCPWVLSDKCVHLSWLRKAFSSPILAELLCQYQVVSHCLLTQQLS